MFGKCCAMLLAMVWNLTATWRLMADWGAGWKTHGMMMSRTRRTSCWLCNEITHDAEDKGANTCENMNTKRTGA
eukprot:7475261-Prorocentrum_lima.AAC.1